MANILDYSILYEGGQEFTEIDRAEAMEYHHTIDVVITSGHAQELYDDYNKRRSEEERMMIGAGTFGRHALISPAKSIDEFCDYHMWLFVNTTARLTSVGGEALQSVVEDTEVESKRSGKADFEFSYIEESIYPKIIELTEKNKKDYMKKVREKLERGKLYYQFARTVDKQLWNQDFDTIKHEARRIENEAREENSKRREE